MVTWLLVERGRHTAEAAKLISDTQNADIHTADDVTKMWHFSADIMKDSRSVRKWVASRISLVNMSLGLTFPRMWQMSTSLA